MLRVILTVTMANSVTVASAQQVGINPASLFKKLDRNGDGQLTAKEIAKDRRPYFDRLLRYGDANKDGKLSLKEFTDAVTEKPSPAGKQDAGRPRPALTREQFGRLDRNKDGKLTLGELAAPLRPRFKPLFDRAKKKELTYAEIVAALQRPPNAEERKRFVEAMFSRLDADRDGKLSTAEIKQERGKKYLAGLLKKAGKQPDGALTKDGFVRAVLEPNTLPAAMINATLRQFDKNGDGAISTAEAEGGLKTNFDRLDRNQDGKLDRRELEFAVRAADANRRTALQRYRKSAEATFDRMDANKDGKVDAAEIPNAGARRYVQFLLQRAGKRRDASFTKEEFASAVLNHQREVNATIARALRQQDKDNDGKLSRNEARGFWKANFNRIDRNRDGKLDVGELAAALRASAASAAAKKAKQSSP